MSKFLLVFSVVASALVLFSSGCASASKAPSESSEKAKSYVAPDGRGSVFLYRTGRAVGAAGQLQVNVNGINAGGTAPGTFFRWDLKPGEYTFMSSSSESSAVVAISVKAGEVYFIRQDARMGVSSGRITMKEVSDSKGQQEVAGCKLLVSAYTPD